MPATHLRRVQLGQQANFSTPVAATSILRGVTDGSVTLNHNDMVVEELGRSVSDLVVVSQRHAEGELELLCTYEDILYGLFGLFGPVAPSGGARTFNAPVTAYAAPQIYTMEYGAPGAEYRVVGGIVSEWTLRYEANAGVTESWSFIGRNIQANAMTGSLPTRVVTPVLSRHASWFIDNIGTAHGTTAIPGTVIEAELTINTNRHLKMFEGAQPLDWGEGRWEAQLSITAEFNATAKAWVDALLADRVARNIRVNFVETANTRELRIDFTGLIAEPIELFGDRDGNMTAELTFKALVAGPLNNWLQIRVINGVGSLP
jgi:hypothetical protein